eukprot:3967424-Amphidinium_carterae.1
MQERNWPMQLVPNAYYRQVPDRIGSDYLSEQKYKKLARRRYGEDKYTRQSLSHKGSIKFRSSDMWNLEYYNEACSAEQRFE